MIFREKLCNGIFGQKVIQNEFCKFYNKLMWQIFFIFCMKLQQHKGKNYFHKNFCFGGSQDKNFPKWAGNEGFFSFLLIEA